MLDIIRKRLGAYIPQAIHCEPSIRAAAAILLFEKEEDIFCVLTKRSDTVRFHKGEVSFPGGMVEPDDRDAVHTALRETSEEIGVRHEDVEIIGRLDDTGTLTGFVITPVVGIIPHPYDFTTNPEEVAHLIFLPYSQVRNHQPVSILTEHEGRRWTVPSIHYNGNRIWGATCRILLRFRNIIENENP